MAASNLNLTSLLQQAGFKGAGLQTMFRIIMAESGGRANAYNGNAATGDNSYGLAQINMIGNIGVSRLKQYGLTSYDQLFDPLTNLRAAYRISKGGTNFNAWTTYTKGSYLSHSYDPSYVVNTKPSNNVPNGSGGGLVAPNATVTGSPDKLDINSLADTYGWDAAFLNSIPELKNLFTQALNNPSGQWTTQKFVAMLQQTNWWKQNSDSVRQNLLQATKDPATYKANVAQKAADIGAMASAMGATLTATALQKIAERAYTTGLDDTQIKAALAGFVQYGKDGTLGGEAGSIADQLRSLAYQNGIKISDPYILKAAQNVEGGLSTVELEGSHLRALAASAFPQWKTQIQAGQNMSDIASPYMQSMASTLEIDPAQIDLFDPTIRKALSGTPDPKTGEPTAQGLWSFESGLKQDPRWMQTNNARESLMGVAHGVLSSFGLES